MKQLLCTLSLAIIIAACNNDKDDVNSSDSAAIVVPDSLLVYQVDAEAKIMKRFTEIPADSITVERVINGLNQKYPEVRMQFIKQSNDTVYVKFADGGEYIGERMGSTGSAAYLSDAALNVTGVNGVNYVNFAVERHSHISTSVLGKKDFEEFKEEK